MPDRDRDNDDFWGALSDEDEATSGSETSAETSPVVRRREAPVVSQPEEPKPGRRRPGRWNWSIRVGIAAVVGYGLGLITPTPEGIEVSRDDEQDEVRIEIESGEHRFVIDNATDLTADELSQVIDDLVSQAGDRADTGG
jgi:hypothetical protein